MESEPTRIMIAVNESSIKGYPHPSISSKRAFEWTLQKIVRSNTSAFKLLFLHVHVPDEDVGSSRGISSFGLACLRFDKQGRMVPQMAPLYLFWHVWSKHNVDVPNEELSHEGLKEFFIKTLMPVGDGFDDMDSIYASPEDFKNLERRDKARGLQLLEHFVKSSHEFGVSCGAWIKKGDPKEVICHEVKRIQPDLLVVGCRGLGPFQRVFVGTVSEFCVKHAECPVITIKRRPDEIPQDPVDD